MSERDYAAEMKLPEGKTCAECTYVAGCMVFDITTLDATFCEWWPNRFRFDEARAERIRKDEAWARANGVPLVCPHEQKGEPCTCFDRFRR
jgi:hypothetical protein